MSGISGTLFGVEERIRAKLAAAGAISTETAVSAEEAKFDAQEENWIHYIAGGLFSRIKKTAQNLYYTAG